MTINSYQQTLLQSNNVEIITMSFRFILSFIIIILSPKYARTIYNFRLFCKQSFRCTFQSLLWLRMRQPYFPWQVLIAGDSGRESLLAPPYGGDAGQPDVYPKAFRASKLQNTIKMALSKFSLYLVLLSFNAIFTCSKIRSKLFTMLLKST